MGRKIKQVKVGQKREGAAKPAGIAEIKLWPGRHGAAARI